MDYEVSFPFTLIFKYIFCENLLLMTYVYVSISLKTSLKTSLKIFFKINHSCLKEVIAQLHNDLYYKERVI